LGFAESLRAELSDLAPALETTVVCPYFIDTGMFDGAKTRFPRLLPILKEQVVADNVIQAIARNRARVHLPALVNFIPAARILPTIALDGMMSFLGVNVSMDHFHGR
jgi:all-trans-retinol dehydrogenase (NAD+)